jgi:dipeptidyl aminopeptidase/acylaminoacyl peptidase
VFWGALLGAVLACGVAAARADPPQLEVYGKLPMIQQVSLSPDGARLAAAVTNGESRTIVVTDLATGKVVGGLNAGERKIRSIQWAGPNHLIVTQSTTGNIMFVQSGREEWFVAIDYNLAKHTQRPLNANMGGKVVRALNVIYGRPMVRVIDGHPYVFTMTSLFVAGRGQLALFRVDLDHDDVTDVVDTGSPHTTDYLVDAAGRPMAETQYDAAKKQWALRIWKSGAWHAVKNGEAAIEQPGIAGLGRDSAKVLVWFPAPEGDTTRELSLEGEAWSDPSPASDMLIYDDATYRLIGQATITGDETRYSFFDPAYQKVWNALTAAYKGDKVDLVSASDNWRRFILRVDSATAGPAFAMVDLDKGKGVWIGDEYAGLKPEAISPVRAISLKAQDGLALNGYLTLPRDRPGKGLPLVVLPHGGPAARDAPGFDWWAQALASRGYAVLQLNYRGSEGYGWSFQSAGFGEWGRKMQTDLSDGVRYLAAEGTIDPARVCIVGGSYGGYAALAGVTLDPGVYRCAASIAGPSDLGKMVDEARVEDGAVAQRYWLRYMGPRNRLAAISPASHADKVTVPVLLIHGKDDTVVPYDQSLIMADALRKAGKSVELVTLKQEDHWLSRGETRLEMLRAVTAFLEKNNPPD